MADKPGSYNQARHRHGRRRTCELSISVDVRSVRLVDEGARHESNEFANASASARRRDAKTIVISSDGVGSVSWLSVIRLPRQFGKLLIESCLIPPANRFFRAGPLSITSAMKIGRMCRFRSSRERPSLYPAASAAALSFRPVIPIPEDLNLESTGLRLRRRMGLGAGTWVETVAVEIATKAAVVRAEVAVVDGLLQSLCGRKFLVRLRPSVMQ